MAKAKKTTTPTDAPASAPTAAPKKKAAVKAKKQAAVPAATAPTIDTRLAAETAAKLLAAGLPATAGTAAASKESASFKQLKQSLAKPAASGLDSVLDKTASPASRKPNQPFGGGPRGPAAGGRNQTFGADVNRAGVPRRTSGG